MKKLVNFVCFLLMTVVAPAQTPEEILTRMEEEMSKHEKEGLIMTVDTKMPIVGTMSIKSYMLGDKSRTETSVKQYKIIVWSDGKTDWTYDSKNNVVEIQHAKPNADDSNDAEMFSGITDGYDVSLKKETADAWYIFCKKSKNNKDKDDPGKMDVVVAKGTYFPISLSAKAYGVSMTLRDISFGVTEEQVSFRPESVPGAQIVDKRK